MTNLLEVRNIHTFIGQFHILEGVSVEVPAGEIVALLGRNGAGKTTTLKSILGLTPPRSGQVIFDGQEIQGRRRFRDRLAGHRLRAGAPRHLPRPERAARTSRSPSARRAIWSASPISSSSCSPTCSG